jgi:hypothetical protein
VRRSYIFVWSFILILLFPSISRVDATGDYDDYIYSLDIISYVDPLTAGGTGSITVKVGANTAVNIHVELKGHFSWDEWTYSSDAISVEAGTRTVNGEVTVPYKLLIEPASCYYYYVYITLRDDSWNSQAWGLVQKIEVIPPIEVNQEELLALMSHLKWLVHTSTLSEGIKNSLTSKLEVTGWQIDSAYETDLFSKLNGAIGSLEALINELNSNNEASTYPDSELWEEQAEFIIRRMEQATG